MVERYAVYAYVWSMHDMSLMYLLEWKLLELKWDGFELLNVSYWLIGFNWSFFQQLWLIEVCIFTVSLHHAFLPNPCCSAQKWLPFAWHGSFPLLHWRVRRFQRWVRGWCQMQTKLLTWQMLRGTVAEKLALRLLNVCVEIPCVQHHWGEVDCNVLVRCDHNFIQTQPF